MSRLVDFTWKSRKLLGPHEIEWNGEPFNCRSSSCNSAVCCNHLANTKSQCGKCKCLDRFQTSGYCHRGTCVGKPSCDSICGGKACVDAPIWEPAQTQTMTCSDAVGMLQKRDLYSVTPLMDQIVNQVCDDGRVLDCCKGSGNANSGICGNYWGRTDPEGNCDSIMTTFCANNPNDAACACIKSQFPLPKCSDTRCSNGTAYLTSAMKRDQCQGFFMNCQQYNTIVSAGEASYINQNRVSQDCKQVGTSKAAGSTATGDDDGDGQTSDDAAAGSASSNKRLIIAIVSIVGVTAVLGIAIAVVARRKRPSFGGVRMYGGPRAVPPMPPIGPPPVPYPVASYPVRRQQ